MAFAGDSHLLAAMLTRARTSMTLISSYTPDPTSLLGRYIAAADGLADADEIAFVA